jgi:hypothetical protein
VRRSESEDHFSVKVTFTQKRRDPCRGLLLECQPGILIYQVCAMLEREGTPQSQIAPDFIISAPWEWTELFLTRWAWTFTVRPPI